MGRLVTGVREAEERLAAIGRALQSAYDEELHEATQARDAAIRNLHRAEAMEEASRALGHEEVTSRLVEVIQQLRSAHEKALARLQELSGIEKAIQMRLSEGEPPPEPPRLPAAAAESPPPKPPPVPVEKPEEKVTEDALAASQKQLLARIEEVNRLARKWPPTLAQITVQEHVALSRLLLARFESAGRKSDELAQGLDRLRALVEEMKLTEIVGLASTDAGDWNKLATEARTRRLAFLDARKNITRPG